MKKLFTLALAFAALASCSKVESLETAADRIAFGDAFVEVKTRAAVDPSTTTATINAFDVWAFMNEPAGTVFAGERVTKSESGVWTYNSLQYWVPSSSYYFYAVSPVGDSNISVNVDEINKTGIGEISFTNADGSCDLLYAAKNVNTDSVISDNPEKVKLQFAHLLSKLKFTFVNEFTNANAHLAVKGVKISDAPGAGSIALNVAAPAWQNTVDQQTVLAFGDVNSGNPFDITLSEEAAVERLTIPADNTRRYTIEFDLELYYGTELAFTSHKVGMLEDQAFAIGKQYNIIVRIGAENFSDEALKPIEFDVIVDEWVDGEFNGTIDKENGTTEPEEPEQPAEPVALATPAVTASVDVNVVTLTWAAVEGAANYSVQVDDDVAETVAGTSYTFEGDYEVEYTFTVIALPADAAANTASEAAVVKATTEAKPVVAPTTMTVADFLALKDTANQYELTGKITRVANEVYGNFDLTDDTGTIYVYGLLTPSEEQQKQWAAAGLRLGDTITVKGAYTEYNGTAQIKNATYVSHIAAPFVSAASATIESDVTTATLEVEANVAWSVACDAAWVTSFTQSGENNGTIEVVLEANETEEARVATFTFTADGVETVTAQITQKAKPAAGEIAGGNDDFTNLSTNTSYVTTTTKGGWKGVNCAILQGGTSDNNPTYKMIGTSSATKAFCMNGKTSAVGTITSPTLTTGCGTLKFNYGLPFSDTKIKFRVDIKQAGAVVKTFTVDVASATKNQAYAHEEVINIAGEFQIVFTNLSPSNSTSNKDRTAIWNVEWTGCN